jgi:hypothetical protein
MGLRRCASLGRRGRGRCAVDGVAPRCAMLVPVRRETLDLLVTLRTTSGVFSPMLATLLLVALPVAGAAGGPSTRGLVELTAQGEVLFLPRHHVQPFDAWLYSRSAASCAEVERAMLDVENWPRSFDNIESARATRVGDTVTYELELTVAFSPTIHGAITRVAPGRLRFNDASTKAYSEYQLEDLTDGSCLFRYRIVEERGRSSGWVAVLKGLEKTSGDAGNFAAAVSSSRGFGRPERARRVAAGRAASETLGNLAGRGTVVTIDRSGARPVYVVRRRVDAKFDEVAWALRNKKDWPDRTAVVKRASDRGRTAEYTVAGFGGRVSFTTTVADEVDAGGVLTLAESASGGDLAASDGGWRWRVAPVEGGVDVELRFACDIVAGSTVMSTVAATDPIARESFMLHVALSLMGDLVPGRPLPLPAPVVATSTASEPVAALREGDAAVGVAR